MTIVETCAINGGVDTHADVHVAAALDPIGGLLGVREFAATPAGYARLLDWLAGFGTVCLVGIEGTGSYGVGLARHVTAAGVRAVEVDTGAEGGSEAESRAHGNNAGPRWGLPTARLLCGLKQAPSITGVSGQPLPDEAVQRDLQYFRQIRPRHAGRPYRRAA
ncbi:MAG TPA: transposase [Streptosporangiaceae bacterium]